MEAEKFNPCEICIDEKCGGSRECHCRECELRSSCPKYLRATIRITNRCTQACGHCRFASSPDSKIMMTVDEAEKIAMFISANMVFDVNLMGGEFFCNPEWYRIFDLLIGAAGHARIVTNGDRQVQGGKQKILQDIHTELPSVRAVHVAACRSLRTQGIIFPGRNSVTVFTLSLRYRNTKRT